MHSPFPHATLRKFGYPENLVHQGKHWAVLVRPAQVTLGSLVLCALGDETAYGALSPDAFREQGEFTAIYESVLKSLNNFDKINYLMLMMVDPHVHFHVIPRYAGSREHEGTSYPDSGWPGLPDLSDTKPAPASLIEAIRLAWLDRYSG